MRFSFAFAFLAVASACLPAEAAEPQYGAFPAEPRLNGRGSSPVLSTADAKAYRTRLREGAAQRSNFDGHYSFVTWGCGSGCATGAVADLRTGQVTFMPFTMCCADSFYDEPGFDYIKFRKDSRLVVFYGKRDEDGPEGKFYYTFEGGQFHPVSSELTKSSDIAKVEPPTRTVNMPVCRNLPSDAERLACYDKLAGH